MTHEEMERAIEFVLSQQAQFATNLQQLADTQVTFQNQLNKVNEAVVATIGMIGKLAQAQERTEKEVQELSHKLDALAQRGGETEERLNAFIAVVERYISERRNGKKRD